MHLPLETTPTWPAPATRIAEARTLLVELCARSSREAPILVAPHGDVDGLTAGVITARTIERLGGTPLVMLPGKGEHVHSPSMRARLATIRATGLVVLDMGSRPGPIVEGLPTLVIDHHDARDIPDDTVFLSAAGCEPVVPTGLLAYLVCSPLTRIDDLAWLAALSAYGDLGDAHPFAAALAPVLAEHKISHFRETVSLINAARRVGAYRPDVALAALLAARGPADIARAAVARDVGRDITRDGHAADEARRRAELAARRTELVAFRAEVNAEVTRVARVPPRVVGNVALIRFTSSAQIHPLIATRWMRRLAPNIVIVANDGYLPGRVNFAIRCAADVDLLAFLRALPLGPVEGEFANGHPRATGGSIPKHEFARLLAALGFPPK